MISTHVYNDMYNKVKCEDVPGMMGYIHPFFPFYPLFSFLFRFSQPVTRTLNSNLALTRTKIDFYAMEAMEKRPGDKVASGENNGTESGS